jgi:hypothetical protein
MIYTGNNGRVYIARAQASALTGAFTLNILAGQGVSLNGNYYVYNVRGDGAGAYARAGSTVLSTDSSRACTFTIVSGGYNYEAGDVVRFAYTDAAGNRVDVTGDFAIDTTVTTGIDSEREILDDYYRIAKIRSWNLTSNSEVVETTALGDATKTYAPSLTSGEGSATLMFYEDTLSNAGIDRQKDTFELIDLLFPRSAPPRVVLNLAIDGSATGFVGQVGGQAIWKTNFLFYAYITSASIGSTYGEVVTIDTSFTVDGPLIDVPYKPGVVKL